MNQESWWKQGLKKTLMAHNPTGTLTPKCVSIFWSANIGVDVLAVVFFYLNELLGKLYSFVDILKGILDYPKPLQYKKDSGVRRKFWKKKHVRSSKFLLCGRGMKLFHLEIYQYYNNTLTDTGFVSIPLKEPQKLPLWTLLRMNTLRRTIPSFLTPV